MRPLSGKPEDQPTAAEGLVSKHVLLFLAEGFEDAEAICALDVLGWTMYRPSIATISVDITGFRDRVHGGFGTAYDIDVPLPDIDASRYDALVIPGGFHNRGFDEAYDERLHNLIREFRKRECPIATMCVGILPVAEAGALVGGLATTYALSSRHDNLGRLRELGCEPSNEPVVEWNGIISCSGPAHSEQVMYRLLSLLVGQPAMEEVARYRRGTLL